MHAYPVNVRVLRSAELLLRLSLILVMFLGGPGKMFAWSKFVDVGSAGFVGSPLPMGFARGFLYTVPVIEFVLGAWIISGYKREWALFGVGGLLLIFQFGHMMMQDFPGLSRVIVDLLLVVGCLCLPPFQWLARPAREEAVTYENAEPVLAGRA